MALVLPAVPHIHAEIVYLPSGMLVAENADAASTPGAASLGVVEVSAVAAVGRGSLEEVRIRDGAAEERMLRSG